MSVPIPFLCRARLLTSANVVKNHRGPMNFMVQFLKPINTKYVIK